MFAINQQKSSFITTISMFFHPYDSIAASRFSNLSAPPPQSFDLHLIEFVLELYLRHIFTKIIRHVHHQSSIVL